MNQITHQKAQALLQAAADRSLPMADRSALDTHLAQCVKCRVYAGQLAEVENGLRRVMAQQWNRRARPLSLETIKGRAQRAAFQRQASATFGRYAVVPLLALTFFMVMSIKTTGAQSTMSVPNGFASSTMDFGFQVPRPPASSTATNAATAPTCSRLSYLVQKGDTLRSIAYRFGVSPETIIAYNGLSSDQIEANLVLTIPLCGGAIADTSATPTLTGTVVPASGGNNPSPRG